MISKGSESEKGLHIKGKEEAGLFFFCFFLCFVHIFFLLFFFFTSATSSTALANTSLISSSATFPENRFNHDTSHALQRRSPVPRRDQYVSVSSNVRCSAVCVTAPCSTAVFHSPPASGQFLWANSSAFGGPWVLSPWLRGGPGPCSLDVAVFLHPKRSGQYTIWLIERDKPPVAFFSTDTLPHITG